MKINNQSLIITDPTYFAKSEDWGNSDGGFNWKTMGISDTIVSDYIWKNTGFGDGRGKVYSLEKDKINISTNLQSPLDSVLVGEFTVDSGTFGIFILDEILRYCPNFMDTIDSKCYCIIEDFKGEVSDFSIDSIFHVRTNHIEGISDDKKCISFFTHWK